MTPSIRGADNLLNMEPRRSGRKATSQLEAKSNEEEDSNDEEGEIRGNKTPKATNHAPIPRMGKADNTKIILLIDLDTDDLSTIRSTIDKHNLATRVRNFKLNMHHERTSRHWRK